MSPVHPQRHQGFDQTCAQGSEAKWKLLLAAMSRSAQAKSYRTEALVEASGSTPHLMGRGPGRPVGCLMGTAERPT